MLEQPSPDKQSTKVAVLASSEDQCHHLQSLLEKSGLLVVLSQQARSSSLENITNTTPDVLLIDIGDDDDEGWNFVDNISEQSSIPILFNDSGSNGVSIASSSEIWARKLADKLTHLAHGENETVLAKPQEPPFPLSSTQPASKQQAATKSDNKPQESSPAVKHGSIPNEASSSAFVIDMGDTEVKDEDTDSNSTSHEVPNLNVWVLGASLGGPQAVRQFLSSISAELPVAFILAQHIGANHINLLAEQLNRVTAFTVIPGKNGHRLRHGEVILTPADKEISFTEDAYLALRPAPPNAIYSPSIDNVMIEVAKRFGEKAGTIVFSGMGDDGMHGCEAIAEHKGIVWAQDIASCVVSSMPDHARKTGTVSYSANPEQLAEQLYKYYCG